MGKYTARIAKKYCPGSNTLKITLVNVIVLLGDWTDTLHRYLLLWNSILNSAYLRSIQ